MDEDGLVKVPRKHTDMETEYLLVLVNGLMYKFQYAIRTDADYIKIPVKDINPEDSVVFMRFYGIIDFVFDLLIAISILIRLMDSSTSLSNMRS